MQLQPRAGLPMKEAMSCGGDDTAKRPWKCRLQAGWSLIEVVVTTAIVGTLAVAVIMSMIPQVTSAKRNQCIANLQMIESAKNSWVADHPGQTMVPPGPDNPDPLAQYIRGGVVPTTCPGDGKTPYTNPPTTTSTAGMYDPTQPCYCPFHQQQAYATPPPSSP
jgi:prepilin-type N-terminal cleavage/methylation domain-containing protein